MHNRFVYGALLLALVWASGPARAQDEGGFGLDLSGDSTPQAPLEQGEEPPPDTGSLGLDLSTGPSAELQPRLAFVGLETPERAGAAVSKRWLAWLQSAAFRTGRVVRAADPAEARKQLAADYASVVRCHEAACVTNAAETLDADLLTTARLALEDGGWTLRLWTYDRDRGVVEMDVVTGRKPAESAFFREAGAALAKRVTELARPRTLLKVSCNVSQAVVRVGERMLGVGNVEAKLPPGEVQLVVEADEYTTSTQTLTLVPGETKEVAVRLELNGPAPEGPGLDAVASVKKSRGASGPSVFSRPALYTTVLGLAAVGAGVALGMSLQGTGQGIDGEGVREITRAQYLAAQRKDVLATALMAGGGAVAAGSLVWLIVVPQRSGPVSSSVAPVAGGSSNQGMALHFVFGGSF
ncbi:PEGA domain-containing protein [Melittangium boletus]|uniref:PEGA domain-containing protein n=1 Tax=Melittangium boletus DSM 14713 TaxID=1294270 RepID=A0A250II73_9BACT|nr:PEGA domain-containing protein [Melittangium boletus]ATB30861.1 hypothetical protein MEBOL_004323 [Melittangium boletus DSM 14713]